MVGSGDDIVLRITYRRLNELKESNVPFAALLAHPSDNVKRCGFVVRVRFPRRTHMNTQEYKDTSKT
jgi:hypothetical protein